ncbi:MAG TPA: DMT family transporter [Acidimicrobiia bacterium]|nr:DMT family transporter [Acidimicrobiia bacterium]
MKAWFLIVVTGLMFGTLGLCTKYLTTRGVDPLICAAVPFGLSAVIALILHPRRTTAPWREGLAMGAVNAATPALLFNIGFNQLPASLVTLTLALGPVFTAITAHIAFRDDRFSTPKVIGLGLSFGGVAVLAGLPAGSGSRSTLAFVATLVGAAMSGASLVWVRRMAVRYDPRAVLAPMQTGAALVAITAASLTGHPLWNLGADAVELGILGVMGAGTILTYVTSLKASELAPASRVGLMGYLVPVVGVAGGVVVFDESLTANLAVGGLLILAGVTLVGRANRSVAPAMPG